MVYAIAITNEMNLYMFEVMVINEEVGWEDHFTASLFQKVDFEYSPRNTFSRDLAYRQY